MALAFGLTAFETQAHASAGAFTVRVGPPEDAADPAAAAPAAPAAEGAVSESPTPTAAEAPSADPAAAGTQPAPDSAASPTAPAPTVESAPDAAEPAPNAAADPASQDVKPEGAEDPDYASSKDAGTALSGSEGEGRVSSTEQVGDVKEKKEKKGLSHHKTGIIGVGFTYGVSLITAGDKFCGEFSDSRQDPDSRKPLCVGALPPAIDLLAGFGASDRIDVILGVRINLKERAFKTKDCPNAGDTVCNEGKGLFNKKIAIGFMPGVRIFGKQTNRIVKFGGQVQFMYQLEDFSGYRDRENGPSEDDDPANREDEDGVGNHFIGLRGGPVLQIDPHHNFGITFAPSMIPGFRPKAKSEVDAGWFEIGFEASLGIEARFP